MSKTILTSVSVNRASEMVEWAAAQLASGQIER